MSSTEPNETLGILLYSNRQQATLEHMKSLAGADLSLEEIEEDAAAGWSRSLCTDLVQLDDTMGRLRGSEVISPRAGAPHDWAVRLSHPEWGACEAVAVTAQNHEPEHLELWGSYLTDRELRATLLASQQVFLRVLGSDDPLADRKRMFRWAQRLLGDFGAALVDPMSQRPWAPAELRDEVSHDAALGISQVVGLHAVGDGDDVTWLHTHGLAALGGWDIEILRPSAALLGHARVGVYALAAASIAGELTPGRPAKVASPGPRVGLVPVETFLQTGAAKDVALLDGGHRDNRRRAVACDTLGFVGKLLRRGPRPSRLLSTGVEQALFHFPEQATLRMAERAIQTLGRLRQVRAQLEAHDATTAVKLGLQSRQGGMEYLWFEVHDLRPDAVDATLLSEPFDIGGLVAGSRAEHPLEHLVDWIVRTDAGDVTPSSGLALRRLLEAAAT